MISVNIFVYLLKFYFGLSDKDSGELYRNFEKLNTTSINNITSVTPATNIENSRKASYLQKKSPTNQDSEKKSKDINSINSDLMKNPKSDEKNQTKTKKINKDPAAPELSEEEKKQIEELKKTDQKVRTHEQAHVAAGGELIKGGIRYSYKTGPDNKKYAVAGKVNIDLSPVKGDADATIRKMQRVKRAALAPADPSPQDRQIATTASQIESKARLQKNRERDIENDNQYNFISEAGKNKFVEEYMKQQQASNELINAAASTSGVLSKLV